ncbi:hypothetical protein SALB1_3476 [Salinisphaera sp. LB1]|nr:hypothetical protein SALB1_3476 [Salinisphaera sp. LB1]
MLHRCPLSLMVFDMMLMNYHKRVLPPWQPLSRMVERPTLFNGAMPTMLLDRSHKTIS